MSEEPIEGRILDDDEVKKMKYEESWSSFKESINESRRESYRKSRAESFYRPFEYLKFPDRKGPININYL